MSPEERAKDVLSDFDFNAVVTRLLLDEIAQAIREAEDAALETAIQFCEGEAKAKDLPGDDPRFYAGRREAGRRLVRIIRSLKSQEP